jgi:hypothetical protein
VEGAVGGRAVALQPLRNDAIAAAKPKAESQAWRVIFISLHAAQISRSREDIIHIIFEEALLK